MNTTYSHSRPNLTPVLVLIALAIGIALVLPMMQNGLSHGDKSHPGTAEVVRESCENGHQMTFRRDDPDYEYGAYCTKLPDGRWGLQIAIKEAGKWVELTAFSPAVGKAAEEIVRYMELSGWQLVWTK